MYTLQRIMKIALVVVLLFGSASTFARIRPRLYNEIYKAGGIDPYGRWLCVF